MKLKTQRTIDIWYDLFCFKFDVKQSKQTIVIWAEIHVQVIILHKLSDNNYGRTLNYHYIGLVMLVRKNMDVRKDIDVNELERLSNITLRHKLK